jgi:hypothetical protein
MLAVALMPDAAEVLLNPTNIQSLLGAGFLLLLISSDPVRLSQRVHDLLCLVLLGLTGPYVVLLTPFFAVRAWLRKTRWSILLALLAAGLGAVQLGLIVTHPLPAPVPTPRIRPLMALPVVGVRVFGSLFFGNHFSAVASSPGLFALIGGLLGAMTILLLFALGLRPGARRVERSFLCMSCMVILASVIYRMRYGLSDSMFIGNGSRYYYTPQLIVVWLLLATLEARTRFARRAAGCALCLALCINVTRLREPAFPNLHWENYAARIRHGEAVVVPINPVGWQMALQARPPH